MLEESEQELKLSLEKEYDRCDDIIAQKDKKIQECLEKIKDLEKQVQAEKPLLEEESDEYEEEEDEEDLPRNSGNIMWLAQQRDKFLNEPKEK